MSQRYDEVTERLRRSYDGAVDERAGKEIPAWKHAERSMVLEVLQSEGRSSLLEIGAGTGVHGRFFADAGFDVVCTDASSAMVAHCRSAGLVAHQQDFLHLELDRAFDAVFAMNCLLHVPRADLADVLLVVRSVVQPGGLVYIGQYGGVARDGELDGDHYEPKRFFSSLTDEDLVAAGSEHYRIESFRTVDLGADDGMHFQSLLLRHDQP